MHGTYAYGVRKSHTGHADKAHSDDCIYPRKCFLCVQTDTTPAKPETDPSVCRTGYRLNRKSGSG